MPSVSGQRSGEIRDPEFQVDDLEGGSRRVIVS